MSGVVYIFKSMASRAEPWRTPPESERDMRWVTVEDGERRRDYTEENHAITVLGRIRRRGDE